MKNNRIGTSFTMKRIYLGILIAIGVIIVGGLLDASNLVGESSMPTIPIVVSCIVAGMVIGIVFDQEWRDSKQKKKELFT